MARVQIAGIKADGTRPEHDDLFVALREPAYDFDGHDWVEAYLRAGAALALVAADWPGLSRLSPDLRQRCIVVEDSLLALRQLSSQLRRTFNFPIIAVGGSNGKTTTKEMIAALLSAPGQRVSKTSENLNGHTGIPLTLAQRAHTRKNPPHALVVEIGVDAPSAMADHAALVAADVVVLTALGPEHLSGFATWEAAVAEELLLFETGAHTRRVFQTCDPKLRQRINTARSGDVIVADESLSLDARALLRRGISLLRFRTRCDASQNGGSEVELTWAWDSAAATENTPWCGRVHVPMIGRHNAENFAAAFGAALALGRAPDELLRGWPSFTPTPLRCQRIALPRGGLLIDDTYNASPASMSAAFSLLDSPVFSTRRKLVILGDMLDLGAASADWHRALCEPLRRLKNARLFLYGDAMCEVHRVLHAEDSSVMFLPTRDDPRQFLAHFPTELDEIVIFIKGSRAMALDRVVAELSPHPTPRLGGRWQLQFSV